MEGEGNSDERTVQLSFKLMLQVTYAENRENTSLHVHSRQEEGEAGKPFRIALAPQ